MKMGEVVERVIEQHLPPWMEACHKDGVFNTPLYPVLVEVGGKGREGARRGMQEGKAWRGWKV